MLPIQAVLPELKQQLSLCSQVILQAPPGAGKSTYLPLMLLKEKWFTGKIIMLEPRRLAARNIAHYLAKQLGQPVGNIDSAAVTGSYIGLFFLAAVFCSIGIFASSITDNQIVSFIVAIFLCFVVYSGFNSIANLSGDYSIIIDQLGIAYHYASISKGLIDSRNILYFVSVITIMILATKLVLGSRKWD